MVAIRIPRQLNEFIFENLKTAWVKSENVSLVMPSKLSLNEIKSLFLFFEAHLRDEFTSVIMSELAEMNEVPIAFLERIFDQVDIGTQVTISLRSDISDSLLQKCLSSSYPEVLSHVVFNSLVSISDCEFLLNSENGRKVRKDIQRAIELKQNRKYGVTH